MAATNLLTMFAKLTLDTSEYEKGLLGAEKKAAGFGSALKNGLKTAAGLAVKGIAAASAATGAFAATSVKTGMEFDKSMAQVAATLGKTVKDMEEETGTVELSWGTFTGNLRDFAQEMGAKTAFSAKQAADALNYMALAGYDTQESMNMLPNVLNLAAAGNMDLARASDMVTDAQTAFGLKIEDMPQLVDEMAKAASTGNTSVEQLGDAFLVVGGLAKELNGGFVTLADGTQKPTSGIQEMEIAMTAMANAGIKGSASGTHMRNMIMKLASPTKDGAEMMEKLGVNIFDADGNMRSLHEIMGDLSGALGNLTQEEKIKAISELFNTRDLASAEALLAAVNQDWDEIGESILDAEGAAQKMADTQLDNLAGDVTIFKSALEGAQIAVSDKLTPSIREFVQSGTKGLSEFTQKMREGDLSGAIEAIGLALANVVVGISKQIPRMVEAGAQLLVGVGRGLAQNFPVLLESAQELVTFLYNAIATNAPGIIQSGAQILLNIARGISESLPEIMANAASLVSYLAECLVAQLPVLLEIGMQLLNGIGQGIMESSGTIFESAQNIVGFLRDFIIENAPALFESAQNIIQSLYDFIMENAPTLIDSAIQMVSFLASGLVEGIPQLLEQVLPMIEGFTGMLRENAGKIVDAGINLILNLVQGIANAIPTLVQHVPQIVINIAGVINDNMPKILGAGVKIITTLAKGLINAIPVIVQNIPKIIQAIVAVWQAFNWVNLGKNIITAIKNGINLLRETLPTTLKKIGQNAFNFLKGIDWVGLGSSVINFILNGITALVTSIPTVIKGIGDAAVTLFTSIDWIGLGKNVISFIGDGIQSLITLIPEVLGIMIQGVLDLFEFTDWGAVGETIIDTLVGGLEAVISGPIDVITGLVDTLLGLFDFEWSLPDIKLPHLSVDWEDLGPVSIPHISVDWYAKAYDNPWLFTSPTVVGNKGFGDRAGGEIVYGHESLMSDIRNAMGGEKVESLLLAILELLRDQKDSQIVLDSGALVGQLAPAMDAKLGIISARKGRYN